MVVSKSRPEISIVTTLFRSEKFISSFFDSCVQTLAQIDCQNYEIVFVDDGSPDNSVDKVLELKKENNRVILVRLSRNFGHHYAASAGLSYSTGDLVYITDCDLEVSPSTLAIFYKELMEGGYDVVYGFQQKRSGKFFHRVSGEIFWKTFNFCSQIKVQPNIVTERLCRRKYIDSLLLLGDKNLFLAGMMHWVGFEQKALPVERKPRIGRSGYSFVNRIDLLIESITSFTSFPLKIIFYVGLLIMMGSFITAVGLVILRLVSEGNVLAGWTSIVTLILGIFGFLIMAVGLVGLYLSKTYQQAQNRPLYIVREIFE
jgi:putative glycosyltransferase